MQLQYGQQPKNGTDAFLPGDVLILTKLGCIVSLWSSALYTVVWTSWYKVLLG